MLASRKSPGNPFNGIDSVHAYVLLVISMEVRCVVRFAQFGVHPDNNSKEATYFGQREIIAYIIWF